MSQKKAFLLSIEPAEIIFPVPADKKNVEPGRITLTNPTNFPYAFKIKTTAPAQFCVKPCLGRIDPGQTIHVEVRLSSFEAKKVKFLIQAADCQPNEDPNNLSAKFSSADVAEFLIRGLVVPAGGDSAAGEAGELLQTVGEIREVPVATSTPQAATATLNDPVSAAAVATAAGFAPAPGEQSSAAAAAAAAEAGVTLASRSDEAADKKDSLKSLSCEVSTETKDKVVIVVTNTARALVAYKIKTTAPKDFLVKPSCGLLQPGDQASISVSPLDASNVSVKAKFLVSAVVLAANEQPDPASVPEFFKNVDAARLEERKMRLPFGDATLPLPAPSAVQSAPQGIAGVQAATTITTANPTLPLPPVPVSKLPTPTPVVAAPAAPRADDPLALRSIRPDEGVLRRRKAEEAGASASASSTTVSATTTTNKAPTSINSLGDLQALATTNNVHAIAIVLIAFVLGVLFGYFVLA